MYPLGTKRKMANASIDTETDPSAQKTSAPASKATGADRRFGVMSRAELSRPVHNHGRHGYFLMANARKVV
jgi:hypothetical protein